MTFEGLLSVFLFGSFLMFMFLPQLVWHGIIWKDRVLVFIASQASVVLLALWSQLINFCLNRNHNLYPKWLAIHKTEGSGQTYWPAVPISRKSRRQNKQLLPSLFILSASSSSPPPLPPPPPPPPPLAFFLCLLSPQWGTYLQWPRIFCSFL